MQSKYCAVDVERVLWGAPDGASCTPGVDWRDQYPGAWSADRALLEIERVHINAGVSNFSCEPCAPSLGFARGDDRAASQKVSCISIRLDGEIDLDMLNRWVLRTLKDFEIL